MKRPVFWMANLYIGGIILQHCRDNSFCILLFAIFMMFLLGALTKKVSLYGVVGLFLIVAFLGSLNYRSHYEYEGKLAAFDNHEIYIIGDILEQSAGTSTQYTLLTRQIHFEGKNIAVKEKMLIRVYTEEEAVLPQIGDRIAAAGTLRVPELQRNPKMFDYRLYLKSKNIQRMMYLKPQQIQRLGKADIPLHIKCAAKIKASVKEKLQQVFLREEGNMLLAVLLGEKDLLEDEQQRIYRDTGIAHIFAVSGLHVGIIFIFLNKIFNGLRTAFRTPIILCLLWGYAAITGFSPSVMRATVLIALLATAPILNRKYDSLSAIGTAAFLFLAVNPILLMHVGFQLSFAAALSIALLYLPIYKRINKIPEVPRQLLAASVAAQLGTMPVIAYHFNLVSPVALLLNIPIVWIIGYLVPFGFVAIILSYISMPIARLAGKFILLFIDCINCLSQWAHQIPHAYLQVVSPSIFFMLIYYLLLYISAVNSTYFSKENHYIRKKAMLLLIGIYISGSLLIAVIPKDKEIIFVDVGQGDCTLIRTAQGKNILIDGGGNFGRMTEGVEPVDRFLVEFLLKNRISKIHMMILSHPHGDHMGGLIEVVRKMPVEILVVSKDVLQRKEWIPLQKSAQEKHIQVVYAERGDQMRVGDAVFFHVLSPGKALLHGSRDDTNNNSLVVMLEYEGRRILFTGDIEEAMEGLILQQYPVTPIDVLKIAHHGSRFSTTEDFLDHFLSKIAVIQVGKNSFGHPHPLVIERLRNRNIEIYRNDRQGAIKMKIKKGSIDIKTMLD